MEQKQKWKKCPKCDGYIPEEWKRHDKCGWVRTKDIRVKDVTQVEEIERWIGEIQTSLLNVQKQLNDILKKINY